MDGTAHPTPRARLAWRRLLHLRHRMRLRAAKCVVGIGEVLRLGAFLRLDYPPSRVAGPRYGYGRPPHPELAELIGASRPAFAEAVAGLAAHAGDLRRIPVVGRGGLEPEWVNGWLPGLDGAALYGFTRDRRPNRYLEIGSGASTRFVARARADGGLATHITSIDPSPRSGVDPLCDAIQRVGLEEADQAPFAAVEAGDIIYFDGSHRAFMGSDVVVFFLEILPRLAPGVLVGIHDVYLPDDYPPDVEAAWYSEQYLLAAWLLASPGSFRLVLAASFAARDPRLGGDVDALWRRVGLPGIERHGVAFWFETH